MGNVQSDIQLADGSTRVPNMDDGLELDGLELQIALDELAAGSDVALKKFYARQAGVDPSTVSLRKRSFHEIDGATYLYLGKLDSLDPSSAGADAFSPPASSRKYINIMGRYENQPYQYNPLNDSTQQLRLLRLGECEKEGAEPGFYDHLKTQTFDLESAPDYFCLSYVWGSPEKFVPVNCDRGTLQVTQNLFHALKNVFIRYPTCYLWADGICINQDDLEERARQVRLMGQIYTKCKMVLAHPGHFRYARVSSGDERAAERDSPPKKAGYDSTLDETMEKSSATLNEPHISDSTTTPPDEPSNSGQTAENYRDTSQARSAISLMNLIARIWYRQEDHEVVMDSEWYSLPATEGEDTKIWDNLLSFWQEDWLWRTWVLPECVLAPKVVVMYGDYVVSLDAIMDFWDAAHKHGLPKVLRHGVLADSFSKIMHLTPVTTFLALRRRRVPQQDVETPGKKTSQDASEAGTSTETVTGMREITTAQAATSHVWKDVPDMLELLALCRNNRATDDRDKVYALLGLADDSISRGIQPSYLPSNTPAKTFTELARQYANTGRAAELLEHAGLDHNIPGLPSWVPDWTHQSRSRLRTHLYSTTRGTVGSVVVIDDHTNQLQMRGAILSRVKGAGPAWRYYSNVSNQQPFAPLDPGSGELIELPPLSAEDARCFVRDFALQMSKHPGLTTSKSYPGGLEEAVARTLCADCSWSGERLSSSEATLQDFMKSFEAFNKFYARGPDSQQSHPEPESQSRVHISGYFHWRLDCDEQEEERLMKELWPFAMAMQEVMRGRRFAVLEGGRLAVIPWSAERGDLVIILEGARVPFVVRTINNEEVKRQSRDKSQARIVELVGDCYVHGIMDGELDIAAHGNEVDRTALNSQELTMAWEEMGLC